MKPTPALPRFLLPLLLCLVTVTVGGDDTPAIAPSIQVNGSANGTISPASDVDYWRIDVHSAGLVVVETRGNTDTVGALEDASGNTLATNDDGGSVGYNFRIEQYAAAGTYYIRVSGYDDETGPYTLHTRHGPESGGGGGVSGRRESVGQYFGDLNGDGNDDVLLRHTDGRWHYSPMNGPAFLADQRGAAALTRNLDWQFAAIGDLNGDGRDDVLLRRVTDGRWYYYPMNGRQHLADQRGGANIISDLNWQLAGIGDLNGDGRDDVLLRHTDGRWLYYPMDGREYIAGQRATANLTRDLNWQVAGIGDLNGDGNDDVLLRHTDGRWHYYPMNGPAFLADQHGAAALTSNLDWQFAGIGDLNGDGRDDVLLRRVTDGRWYYYPMNGRRHLMDQRGGANIISDLNWQLAGIGDLNNDGRDDVLLRHTDGRWLYYPMNGREYIAGRRATANLTRDLDWGISSTSATASPPEPAEPPEPSEPLPEQPDLVASTPIADDYNLISGASLTLTVTVRNRGIVQSDATRLRWYRSPDSRISADEDTEVSDVLLDSLAGADISYQSVTLSAPNDPGTYWYGVCVDTVTGESDTANNCSGGIPIGVHTPDLVISVVELYLEEDVVINKRFLMPGDPLALQVTVANWGTVTSEASTLRYYRSLDKHISPGDTVVGSDRVDSLASGDTSVEAITLSAPDDPGRYWYGACVEPITGESDVGNNCLGTHSIGVGTDLVVDIPTVSKSFLEPGESFTLTATVRNQGSANSAASRLRYYRSTNSTISTSDTQVGTEPVPGLPASDSASVSITLLAPSADGRYWYGACVEPHAGESDADNNCSGGVRIAVGGDAPIEMVSIPRGSFRMGDLSYGLEDGLVYLPVHSVTVPAFRLGKYEVTFAQWDTCVADGGCNGYTPDDVWRDRGNRPVTNVSWDDVQSFIEWLNGKTDGNYRLPSEAEWEYAARAGSTTEYSWGDDIGNNLANCFLDACGDSYSGPAPVGSFPANTWGLHDMHGNVWELVQDCWNDSYNGAPTDGSAWTSGDCSQRVVRGGSWMSYSPRALRSAARGWDGRTVRDDITGFRLAQDE